MKDNIRCFDWVASIYDLTRGLPEELYSKIGMEIKELVLLKQHLGCLEIGVGTGRIASCLAEALECRMIGVDISYSMLSESIKNPLTSNKLDLITADGNSLPFKQKFDFIITSHVLHLVKDHFQFIQSILDNLAPQGTYVDLNAYVNHEQTLPFKIFYGYLAENGYRHFFRNDLIRKELRVFFGKRGWKESESSLQSEFFIQMNTLVRFIKNRVFSHQRLISDQLYVRGLNHLFKELEDRDIDLGQEVTIPAYANILAFINQENI
jgi:ubiquinone/menaquinone biosynthesis C-methylase UbiE